jgi:hypothetical protein
MYKPDTKMKKYILLAVLFIVASVADAQTNNEPAKDSMATLPVVMVKARFLNDTDRYHYNQMKFYVTTILPYLNASTKLFKDINAKDNEEGVSRRERRRYINTKEDEMRTQFEDKVKSLNVTQGALLVKLISRQTELNIYKMLLEFKNPLVAIKWQTWARFNGMNLDRKYHPEEEPDLENIMEELGYPLPAGYTKGLMTDN